MTGRIADEWIIGRKVMIMIIKIIIITYKIIIIILH